MKKEKATITAEELDRRFDDGEDITEFLDWDSARRPGLEPRRVNVDLPSWMISELDKQATMIGVTRQSIIKVWLSERIKTEKSEQTSPPNYRPFGTSGTIPADTGSRARSKR